MIMTPLHDPIALSPRLRALDAAIRAARRTVCIERAVLVTRHFRARPRGTPLVLEKARALAAVLRGKRVTIYPDELLVGCFSSHRVGGSLYPELHGVAMLEDLFRFERRRTNPFHIDPADRRCLVTEVIPYWAPRMMVLRGRPLREALAFVADQLSPTFYLVNESGGISHFVPDYARLVTQGTDGMRAAARRAEEPEGAHFLDAVRVALDGLDELAYGYAREASRLAEDETSPARRRELQEIAATCVRVPRSPARTLREALQSILFAQIALNLESLDNGVSPGRLDQLLYPFYRADLDAGRLDREGALELLGCFALKLCEIVPVFSERLTRFHGGLFNGQVVVVGGRGRDGEDAANELSMLFLELMDQLRTRQPNYHARVSTGSPPAYRARIAEALASGSASPALYNDEVIVPVVRSRGVREDDALDYANVGCVEPVPAGKSYFSTDAALLNLPLCLELALNQGRRFGGRRRMGAATPSPEGCRSIDDVLELFRVQLEHAVRRLLRDLRAVEEQNARFHPTPLTSALLDGCVESGRDASRGGARYNGSGVQGVGAVDVGDSLAALQAVVFREQRVGLGEVLRACRADFVGADAVRARLVAAPKYGNDDPRADQLVARVMELFAGALAGERNTRGGAYVAGFYSVTAHEAFGSRCGALPSGRRAGEPLSSGLSPSKGAARNGPTAALCSQAALPLALALNGVNFNLELSPVGDAPHDGSRWVEGLVTGGFAAGAMQVQINVLDPKVLLEARDKPGSHPGLLVRVSGYSAYFEDLSPEMQQEVIDRTIHRG